MYWAEFDGIRKADVDGSDVQDVLTAALISPEGIALDVAAGKLYFTDATTRRIERSNLDGSGLESLVGLRNGGSVRGIALDDPRGKMYWVDGGDGVLQRANKDGSDIETLVERLDNRSRIAIDTASAEIYWTNGGLFSVGSIQREPGWL